MKKFAYIIVCDNHSFSTYGGRIETRDYLICWYPNAVVYNSDIDPFWDMGLTWTSFEYFIDCNKKIAENSDLGLSTIFKTKEEAMEFANKFIGGNYWKVIQVLVKKGGVKT